MRTTEFKSRGCGELRIPLDSLLGRRQRGVTKNMALTQTVTVLCQLYFSLWSSLIKQGYYLEYPLPLPTPNKMWGMCWDWQEGGKQQQQPWRTAFWWLISSSKWEKVSGRVEAWGTVILVILLLRERINKHDFTFQIRRELSIGFWSVWHLVEAVEHLFQLEARVTLSPVPIL